jgi:saccharopine dehydrogenase (NAD+, L-lysine-forming)
MIGAMLMLEQEWHKPGVYNVEEFDPDPFMKKLQLHGLPWTEAILEARDDHTSL